jgi:hypothetical protein
MAANPSSALQDPGHALLLQQWLADMERQGQRGMTPLLSLFPSPGHPTAQAATPGSAAAPVPGQAPTADASARRPLEGQLFTTQTVTAYQMSPGETYDWIRGNEPSRQVTATIAEGLKEAAPGKAVPVLLQDGRTAYTHGTNPVQILAKEIELWRPMQRLSAQLSQFQERVNSLAQGFQVQMSLQMGCPPSTMQDALTRLEDRVDHLTARLDRLTTTDRTSQESEVEVAAGRRLVGVNGHTKETLPTQMEALQSRLNGLRTPTQETQQGQGRGR